MKTIIPSPIHVNDLLFVHYAICSPIARAKAVPPGTSALTLKETQVIWLYLSIVIYLLQ